MAIPRVCWTTASLLLFAIPAANAFRSLYVSHIAVDKPQTGWSDRFHSGIFTPGAAIIENCTSVHLAPLTTCPKECPLFAELSDKQCRFACVRDVNCGTGHLGTDNFVPNENVANVEGAACEACQIPGCAKCRTTPMRQKVCQKCKKFGYLSSNQQRCQQPIAVCFYILSAIAGLFGLFLFSWVLDLFLRPRINDKELRKALAYRDNSKLRNIAVENAPLYPEDTNLLFENVGGVGGILFFRFHVMVFLWSLAGSIVYVICALMVMGDGCDFSDGASVDLRPVNRQSDCAQEIWTIMFEPKSRATTSMAHVVFYCFSVICAIAYCAWAEYFVNREQNNNNPAVTEFTAKISQIPIADGSIDIEEELANALADFLGNAEDLVGVSMAWNLRSDPVNFHTAIWFNLDELSRMEEPLLNVAKCIPTITYTCDELEELSSNAARHNLPSIRQGSWGLTMDWIQACVLKWCYGLRDIDPEMFARESEREKHINSFLDCLDTASTGWAVFHSQASRNNAIKKCMETGGIQFKGTTILLSEETLIPNSICWQQLGASQVHVILGTIKAAFTVLFVGLFLAAMMLIPFFHWQTLFHSQHLLVLELAPWIILTILVLVFRAVVSATAFGESRRIGFHSVESTTIAYILLYYITMSATCVFYTTGVLYTTFDAGSTSDSDLTFSPFMLKAIFFHELKQPVETIGSLALVLEPLFRNVIPYFIASRMINTDEQFFNWKAEKLVTLPEFSESRYADLLFQATFASVSVFWYWPGSVHSFVKAFEAIFVMLIIEHCSCLRFYKGWMFSTYGCHDSAQRLFAIPCGILAAGTAHNYYIVKYSPRLLLNIGVFSVHVCIHLGVLEFIFRRVRRKPPVDYELEYQDCTQFEPVTFFSANPIHCLRSKYRFGHKPPFTFYSIGKEHLTQVNHDIGAHFKPMQDKSFTDALSFLQSHRGVREPKFDHDSDSDSNFTKSP